MKQTRWLLAVVAFAALGAHAQDKTCTPAQAAAAFETINSDYEHHCRAARALAETHFDAKQIAAKILRHGLNGDAVAKERIASQIAGYGLLTADH